MFIHPLALLPQSQSMLIAVGCSLIGQHMTWTFRGFLGMSGLVSGHERFLGPPPPKKFHQELSVGAKDKANMGSGM